MELATRPWITAGIALAGAGAIVATPMAMSSPTLPDLQTRAVNLTSGVDPLTEWADVLQAAQANATGIFDQFAAAPFPVLQQEIVNQVGYLQDLIKDPSSISTVLADIQDNLAAAAAAPFAADADPGTLDISHQAIFELLPLFEGDNAAELQPLLDFATSPLSGILLGAVGPLISPMLALNDDITDIGAALSGATPDLTTAFDDLVNIPASLTGALLNGYGDVDLSALLPLLPSDLFSGVSLSSIEVAMGGLLSEGGSLFNALGLGIDLSGVTLTLEPGEAPGMLGSMVELAQVIAESIGWSGTGDPLASLFDMGANTTADLVTDFAGMF
ncbi:outer membrane porin GjpA [Mycobacterium shimoidei]|uniref:outer membrane porin GjpA n=1 Tax=Mycobacterium shimoidei TaxID=29313 RepID=UPI000849665D|nr:outer membrane porin GjpA [Mycobacterium shimoidei]MCV7257316.1 outer membrane porin GjpA [Mycobacterium shimoidei]ODR14348.1 hypothetical protein BHQ16_05405 [Mycobacterium shimoidei]ORW80425.1 hypothetical protein AWC26_11080 [Mycobacterium shimoidei]